GAVQLRQPVAEKEDVGDGVLAGLVGRAARTPDPGGQLGRPVALHGREAPGDPADRPGAPRVHPDDRPHERPPVAAHRHRPRPLRAAGHPGDQPGVDSGLGQDAAGAPPECAPPSGPGPLAPPPPRPVVTTTFSPDVPRSRASRYPSARIATGYGVPGRLAQNRAWPPSPSGTKPCWVTSRPARSIQSR